LRQKPVFLAKFIFSLADAFVKNDNEADVGNEKHDTVNYYSALMHETTLGRRRCTRLLWMVESNAFTCCWSMVL